MEMTKQVQRVTYMSEVNGSGETMRMGWHCGQIKIAYFSKKGIYPPALADCGQVDPMLPGHMIFQKHLEIWNFI